MRNWVGVAARKATDWVAAPLTASWPLWGSPRSAPGCTKSRYVPFLPVSV